MSGPAILNITGTQLPIQFEIPNTATVGEVKQAIRSLRGVPTSRQTLSWGQAGGVLADDRTLESYNIAAGQMVQMGLAVEANTRNPITVTLEAPRYPVWTAEVKCMENTTVGQFKRLVADKLGWRSTGGMELFHHGTAMSDEERLISEYLVLNRSLVHVMFLNGKVPPNHHAMIGQYHVAARF